MKIEILGTGCAKCKSTEKMIQNLAAEHGISAEILKVEDLPKIMGYGVMSTPGIVINGKVVFSGGMPTKKDMLVWMHNAVEPTGNAN